jgi:pimeloyl-ACP methyl ester carboxylesterase
MIKSVCLIIVLLNVCLVNVFAQQEPPINNLVHLPGYKTASPQEPLQFIKKGKGLQVLILIPGLGFDASIFRDFMEYNKKKYTMYAITIPGFGKTKATDLPPSGTSYSNNVWCKRVMEGIDCIVKKENLDKFYIAGHFTLGSEIAFQYAFTRPEKIKGMIALGGQARFVNPRFLETSPRRTFMVVDTFFAPKWFKLVNKSTWDNGMFPADRYSVNKKTATDLWNMSAKVPIPVMVQYLCEYMTIDNTLDFKNASFPVLVLKPSFNPSMLDSSANTALKWQFINEWDKKTKGLPNFTLKTISNSAIFVWKDNPVETYTAIHDFINK